MDKRNDIISETAKALSGESKVNPTEITGFIGFYSKLINLLLYLNCMTELVTEIPLSFSIFIQSEVA